MPDFQAWKRGGNAILGAPRAVDAWRRIQDKPTVIVIARDKVGMLDDQTVRVEWSETVTEGMSSVGTASNRDVIIFGVLGHPTVPDTNIKRGDRFALSGSQYKVVDVLTTLGEVQAKAEAMA